VHEGRGRPRKTGTPDQSFLFFSASPYEIPHVRPNIGWGGQIRPLFRDSFLLSVPGPFLFRPLTQASFFSESVLPVSPVVLGIMDEEEMTNDTSSAQS
jgi:hypothetical protein